MEAKLLVHEWFSCWESNDFYKIPVAENFIHTSPYGTIKGKKAYLEVVEENRDKFLEHKFEILDELYDEHSGCVRYKAIQPDFELEVTEWHKTKNGVITEIIAYYNIPGEVRTDRKIKGLEK